MLYTKLLFPVLLSKIYVPLYLFRNNIAYRKNAIMIKTLKFANKCLVTWTVFRSLKGIYGFLHIR